MGWFSTCLATGFLNYNGHLEFIIIHCNSMYFYECDCYQTSYMSCNRCNSLYMKLNTHVTHAFQLQLLKTTMV
jgi:hypothetical protein